MSSNVSVGRLLEEIKLSHIPLPPPHQVRLNPKAKTAYCDLTTRVVVLNPESKSLEWDYRHEIEHLNKWPRRLKQEFIHYYKALKLIVREEDRKLFRRLKRIIANIVYDALIDTELCQKYPKVKEQIVEYLKSVVKPHILDRARELAVQIKKASWLDYERPEVSFVYAFKWLKENLDRLGDFKRDYEVEYDEDEVAEAIVDLVDEGEDEVEVEEEAERFLGRRVSYRKVLEALVRSRFNFIVKATFDFKVSTEASREVYDVWRLGEPVDELLISETLRSYGIIIPSHNTLKTTTVRARKGKPKRSISGCNLALVVDESGSMQACMKHSRDATLMLIGFAKRYQYPVFLCTFGDNLYYSSRRWRIDHFQLALEFAGEYSPMSATTNVVPALWELLKHARKDMTIYIISDMEIHDALASKGAFKELGKYAPKVVLFLISPRRRFVEQICDVVKSAGISDVRGYWVNPLEASKITEYVVKEINL